MHIIKHPEMVPLLFELLPACAEAVQLAVLRFVNALLDPASMARADRLEAKATHVGG